MKIMSFLGSFYDKFILAFSILTLSASPLLIDPFEKNFETPTNSFSKFKTSRTEGLFSLSPQKLTELMPGEFIFFQRQESKEWEKAEVLSLKLSKRSSLEIYLADGKNIKGDLISSIEFPKNWRARPDSISIRSGRETKFIPFRQILRVKSYQEFTISDHLRDIDWDSVITSFYQRNEFNSESDRFAKTRWLAPKTEDNSSHYDLFTPPIIYIHEGKLTTRMPDIGVNKVEREKFGLEFIKAYKSPYHLKLISWVGQTPYFEDLKSPIDVGTNEYTRNRIEVGKYYKRNTKWKPGQPSFITCTDDDLNRSIKIENFVVQQHKNSKTGGLRLVGRALVNDFQLGGEPFEINSLMTEVYAGDYTFEFIFSLPETQQKTFNFNSQDTGKEYSFSGRKYTIVDIDTTKNIIQISKKDPRELKNISKSFQY